MGGAGTAGRSGQLPVSEHGPIGDMHRVALVGTNGTIDWYCSPSFDAPSMFGAGAGAVYKGTTGIVLEAAGPENRVAMSSALVIAVFVGLSVPVVGAGVALSQGATVPDTVLGFAVLVALGVLLSGWALLRRQPPDPEHGTARSAP